MNEKFKNEAHLHGTLAKDPVIKYTPGGKCVANLTLITKYEKFTEFHRVVAWEKLAEKVEKLTKGDFVKVVGRLQTSSWDDKQTGQKKYATQVVAFQLVIPGDEPADIRPPLTPDQTKESRTGGTATARAILQPAATRNIHGLEVTDDDIPF